MLALIVLVYCVAFIANYMVLSHPTPSYTPDWGEIPNKDGGFDEVLLQAAYRYLLFQEGREGQTGDVLFFRMFERAPIKHCAILVAPKKIIHAYSRHQTCEMTLTPWWARRLTHIFSFPPPHTINKGIS